MVVTGQFARSVEHGQMVIGVAMHSHTGFDVMAAMAICRDLQDQSVQAHAVIVTHCTFMLFTQNVVETAADPWHEG